MGCGGSLIKEDVVMTAAHCIDGGSGYAYVPVPELLVHAGAHNITDDGEPGDPSQGADYVSYEACRYEVHPLYDSDSSRYDVALVFLKQCVALDDRVQLTKMATQQDLEAMLAANGSFVIAGWGTGSDGASDNGMGGSTPTAMQYGYARYVPGDQCQAMLNSSGLFVDPQTMICGGGVPAWGCDQTPPFQDTCQGDSGGPMSLNFENFTHPEKGDQKADRVVGITSFGAGCGLPGKPGVYSNVPMLAQWVEEQLQASPGACKGEAAGCDGGSAGGNGTGSPVLSFKLVANGSNWNAEPDKSVLLGTKESTAYLKCAKACAKDNKRGLCEAFSISVRDSAKRRQQSVVKKYWCDIFDAVPLRTCVPQHPNDFCSKYLSLGAYQAIIIYQ